jgi:hypothetical protein
MNQSSEQIFRLISGGYNLSIEPVNGSKTLKQAEDKNLGADGGVFSLVINRGYPDTGGEKIDFNKPDRATGQTRLNVYRQISGAHRCQLYDSLTGDLNSICLTQHQIVRVCEKYFEWIVDPIPNSQEHTDVRFLFNAGGKYFTAVVNVGRTEDEESRDFIRKINPRRYINFNQCDVTVELFQENDLTFDSPSRRSPRIIVPIN